MFSPVRRPVAVLLSALVIMLPLVLSACGETSTTPLTYGTVEIDVLPDDVGATWHLAGPGGTSRDGAGDATLADMRTGTYTVTWGSVNGFDVPAEATLSLGEGQTITFAGGYAVTGMVFPDSPDKLMMNFQSMYTSMNENALAPMLHEDYVMLLQPSTYAQFPDVGTTLDIVEEQRIHERMFSGLNQTDPLGTLVPAIVGITFQTFARQGTWSTSSPTDPIPDTAYAVYDVVILLSRGSLYSTLKAQGSLKVYVAATDSSLAGEYRQYYRMRGMMDLTSDNKSVETSSWGSIKAVFR